MSKGKAIALLGALAIGALAASASAAILSDNFDSYATQAQFEAAWPKTGTYSAFLDTEKWVSSPKAIKTSPTTSSADLGRNYRNFGGNYTPTDAAPLVATFWMYDTAGATRQYNEIRDYAGSSYADGALAQLYALGIYNSVTAPGEVYDGTKYKARVAYGTGVGWFNLNAPGAPSRSEGWHKFSMVVKSNVVEFYVDDILGRSFSRGTITDFDCFVIGSGLSSAGKAAWTDDVLVTPEPATLVVLGLGSLLAFSRRRS